MRIITVNLLKQSLKDIEQFVGQDGLYPSRSELIRVALNDWIIKYLKETNTLEIAENQLNSEIKEEEFVEVPQGVKKYKLGRKVKT